VRRVRAAATALLVVWPASPSAPASADTAEEIAVQMVQEFELGSGLVPAGLLIAERTQTFAAIAARRGQATARRLVERELAAAAPSHRAEWERILARCYLEHFTPEELESITREGRRSPFAAKLAAEAKKIQSSVNARGAEFFSAYVTEALTRAFEESLAEPS